MTDWTAALLGVIAAFGIAALWRMVQRREPCKLRYLGKHDWQPMVIDGLTLTVDIGEGVTAECDAVGLGDACLRCSTMMLQATMPAARS